MSKLNLKHVLPGLLLALAGANCQAGSIQLTPVRVNLSTAAKVAVVTVRNTGTEESVMQVTLNKWTLDGQQYAYRQSQELVITPATFRVAPGKQQIVRIGLRDEAPASSETAYRLLIEEVPPAPTRGVTQTRLVIRHDLPVFIAPLAAAHPALDIALDCTGEGARLRLTSTGNVHAQVRNITVEDAQKQTLGRLEVVDYLLPDAQKSYALSAFAPATAGKNLVVTALTDQGSFAADVKNSCP